MTAHDTAPAELGELLAKATKGWRVSPTDDTCVIDEDRNIVAQIDGDYNDPDTWPIMEANAALIALAPTLAADNLALRAALGNPAAQDVLAQWRQHEPEIVAEAVEVLEQSEWHKDKAMLAAVAKGRVQQTAPDLDLDWAEPGVPVIGYTDDIPPYGFVRYPPKREQFPDTDDESWNRVEIMAGCLAAVAIIIGMAWVGVL